MPTTGSLGTHADAVLDPAIVKWGWISARTASAPNVSSTIAYTQAIQLDDSGKSTTVKMIRASRDADGPVGLAGAMVERAAQPR